MDPFKCSGQAAFPFRWIDSVLTFALMSLRYPATSVSSDTIRSAGQVHSRGPVFSTFVAQKDQDDKVRVLVSVGAVDGVVAVWKLHV